VYGCERTVGRSPVQTHLHHSHAPSTSTQYSIKLHPQISAKMVHYSTIFLVFAAVVTALPAGTSDADIIESNLSFANWVDTLIADPSTALSPEDAFEQHRIRTGYHQHYRCTHPGAFDLRDHYGSKRVAWDRDMPRGSRSHVQGPLCRGCFMGW
jgi:rRNA maturation protein Nop10